MKKYRPLKDLPFAKAGEILESRILDDGKEYLFWGEIKIEKIENFDDWFEEICENVFFFIDVLSPYKPIQKQNIDESPDWFIKRLKSLGSYFATEEEAEKHLEWLKARAILIQDTKGFEPDWNNKRQWKYSVAYDHVDQSFEFSPMFRRNAGNIYFETLEDAENSIKTHKNEWKTYLGIEE